MRHAWEKWEICEQFSVGAKQRPVHLQRQGQNSGATTRMDMCRGVDWHHVAMHKAVW